MQKMETFKDSETGKVSYELVGVDIGKDVTDQAGSERNPGASLISVDALKALVAEAADYDAFVAAIEAL